MILHSCVVLPANIRQQMRQHPRSHVRRRIVQSARKNHINKSRDRMRWETVTIVLRRESVGLYPPGTQWLFHFGLAHAMILWDKVVVEAEGFVKCQVRWHDKEICKANQRVPHRQSSFSQQTIWKVLETHVRTCDLISVVLSAMSSTFFELSILPGLLLFFDPFALIWPFLIGLRIKIREAQWTLNYLSCQPRNNENARVQFTTPDFWGNMKWMKWMNGYEWIWMDMNGYEWSCLISQMDTVQVLTVLRVLTPSSP